MWIGDGFTRPRPRQPHDAKTHPLPGNTQQSRPSPNSPLVQTSTPRPGARPPPPHHHHPPSSPTARRARLSDPAARRILPVSTFPHFTAPRAFLSRDAAARLLPLPPRRSPPGAPEMNASPHCPHPARRTGAFILHRRARPACAESLTPLGVAHCRPSQWWGTRPQCGGEQREALLMAPSQRA